MLIVNTIGGDKMVKVTHAAISAITSEVQDVIDNGNKPLIRFSDGHWLRGPTASSDSGRVGFRK